MATTVENPIGPDKQTRKWFWMMKYCEKYRIPSAASWAWNRAEEAFKKFIEGEETQC